MCPSVLPSVRNSYPRPCIQLNGPRPCLWITECRNSPFFRFNATAISDAALDGIKTIAPAAAAVAVAAAVAALSGCGAAVTVAVERA